MIRGKGLTRKGRQAATGGDRHEPRQIGTFSPGVPGQADTKKFRLGQICFGEKRGSGSGAKKGA
jgi:hypothetical protein